MKDLTALLESVGPIRPPTNPQAADARRWWSSFQRANGFSGNTSTTVMSVRGWRWLDNTKVAKNVLQTATLNLAPGFTSGDWNPCRWSTPQCREACLGVTAGMNVQTKVQAAKALRTRFFGEHPIEAVRLVYAELGRFQRFNGEAAARLNVTSDVRWHLVAPELFDNNDVTFYDYTKDWGRVWDRWHLTYSADHTRSDQDIITMVHRGFNVAVVCDTPAHAGRGSDTKPKLPLPSTWRGVPAVDGDVSDERFLDPRGCVVLLRCKGGVAKSGAVDGFVRPTFDEGVPHG